MKPIYLKIKGLNSFLDEQKIDFEKLTSRGMFGIFGPTGSGKSTILDGITLALYGNVARKSSNFINTNCDSMKVSFEFQISGFEVKRYLVEREFKRKSNGGINTGKCKIADITEPDNIEILADGVKSLNKKVEEIIGLNLDDFTRTVVLPQGKFSEFLKLEGRERREMLERLFNLQKYGDELSGKLSSKIYQEKNENNILEGELKGYEDVSFEILAQKEKENEEISKKLDGLNAELKECEKAFDEYKEIWNIQSELNKYKEQEKKLQEKKGEINKTLELIKNGESALRVNPYITAYESTVTKVNDISNRFSKVQNAFNDIKPRQEEIKEKWAEAKREKDDKVPYLMIKRQKAEKALEDKKSLNIIIHNMKAAKSEKDLWLSKNNDFSLKSEKIIKEIEEIKEELNKSEKLYEDLKIDENLKEDVQKGIVYEENKERLTKALNKLINQKDEIENESLKITDEGKKLRIELDNIQNSISKKRQDFEKLLNEKPGEHKDVIEMNRLIAVYEEKLKAYNKYLNEIDEAKKKNALIKSEFDNLKIEIKNEDLVIADGEENLKKAQKEEISFKLRGELIEGEACPVCGSIHHVKENIGFEKKYDIDEINNKLNQNKVNLKNLNFRYAKLETEISSNEEKINNNNQQILQLGEDFKIKPIESLKSEALELENKINLYSDKKDLYVKEINELELKNKEKNGEINALRARLKERRNQISLIKKDINDNTEELSAIEEQLKHLSDNLKINNFKEKYKEIRENEIKREKLFKDIKLKRELEKSKNDNKDRLNNEINKAKEEIAKLDSDIRNLEKASKEKSDAITKEGFEIEGLESLLLNIDSSINSINENFSKIDEMKNKYEEEYEKLRENLISLESNKKELEIRKSDEKIKLDDALAEERFNDIDEAKSKYIDKNEMVKLQDITESYKSECSKVEGAIDSYIVKLNNRSVTEEKYNESRQMKEEKSNQVKVVNENKIKCTQEVNLIKEKLDKQKDLLKKKSEYEHRLAVLSDLEKLFKGKKFVEFVAAHKLKYISIEASKRLKEITHGAYGLEVDEDGKFIIRDYKNGGVSRDASTLSGGETFLASLSLALALSAQIQLKGTAPLELFFLDEGFGTLDDELLDVVMSSLEKIHNDKLKIGIISHVESIKNRVPVKLIISPAECGRGGSKAEIEIN